MSRKLKSVGLVLVLALAIGAASAQAASAQSFHSEVEKNVLTGAQVEAVKSKFSFNRELVCDTGTLTGVAFGKTFEQLTLHPQFGAGETCTYEEAPLNVPVKTGGCNFVFGSKVEGKHAPVAIQCEAAKTIVIEMPFGCEIKIPPQEGFIGGVSYENLGKESSRDINAMVTIEEIFFTVKGSACLGYGYMSGGTYNNMSFEGTFTIRAYENTGGEEEVKEGKQVGLWFE